MTPSCRQQSWFVPVSGIWETQKSQADVQVHILNHLLTYSFTKRDSQAVCTLTMRKLFFHQYCHFVTEHLFIHASVTYVSEEQQGITCDLLEKYCGKSPCTTYYLALQGKLSLIFFFCDNSTFKVLGFLDLHAEKTPIIGKATTFPPCFLPQYDLLPFYFLMTSSQR